MSREKKIYTATLLEPALLQVVIQIANREGRSKSDTIRRLIKRALGWTDAEAASPDHGLTTRPL